MADRDLRIRILLAAIDKASKPVEAIEKASNKTSAAVREAQNRLGALNRAQANMTGFRKLKRDTEQTATAMQAAQKRVAELARAMPPVEQRTKTMNVQFAKAQREARELTERFDAEGAALKTLRDRLSAAGLSTKSFGADQRKLKQDIAAAEDALARQQKRQAITEKARARSEAINGAAGKMAVGGASTLAMGVATAAPMIASGKAAMNYEDALAQVRKVTNMTNPQIAAMGDQFLDMSTRIPMAASGLAEIAAAAGAAGIGLDKNGNAARDQRQQLATFTEDAAKMGIAFDMTAEEAGGTMAKWRTAFGLPQPAVVALGDKINAMTNRFGGKAAEVTDIVTRIGPLGKVAGLAAPQIAAMGGTLNAIGVESEVAATGIKNTMLALTKGSAATKSQQEAYEALGLSATDVAKRMQKDASGTIVDVMTRISKLGKAEQPAVLNKLFGSESITAIAPLLTNLDGLKQRLGLVADEAGTAGSMTAEFLAKTATSSGATGLATNALSALNITLGQALLPTITSVAQWVTRTANSFRNWASENPRLASVLTIVATVVGVLLLALGGLGVAAAVLMPVIGALATIFGALAAAEWAMILPIVAWVAAIAGVIAIGFAVYNNWDSIIGKLKSLWEGFKAFMIQAGHMIMEGLLSALSPSRLVGHLINMGRAAIGAFKNVMGIHSPSRVFAELGGHVVGGLTQGFDRRSEDAVGRVSALGRRMTAAMKVGAVTSAVAGGVAAAPAAYAQAAAPASSQIVVHVHAAPGMDEAALARLVATELDRREREKQARRLSSYGDD